MGYFPTGEHRLQAGSYKSANERRAWWVVVGLKMPRGLPRGSLLSGGPPGTGDHEGAEDGDQQHERDQFKGNAVRSEKSDTDGFHRPHVVGWQNGWGGPVYAQAELGNP